MQQHETKLRPPRQSCHIPTPGRLIAEVTSLPATAKARRNDCTLLGQAKCHTPSIAETPDPPAGCQPKAGRSHWDREPQGEGGGRAGAGRTPPPLPQVRFWWQGCGRRAEREPDRPREAEPRARGLALLPALPPSHSVHVRAPLPVCV